MFKITINTPGDKNGTGKWVIKKRNFRRLPNFSCALSPFTKSECLNKSRGDFAYVEMVSTTDIKKRLEIDVSPQDRNIYETLFLTGNIRAPIYGYKYAREAMRTLHLVFVQHPQIPRFLQTFRGIWPMPLSLLNHSALAFFAQRTRIPTSTRSIGFYVIWVCISSISSSSSSSHVAFPIGNCYLFV